MPIVLLDRQLVVARLRAQVTALRKVAGSAEFAAAQADLRQVPAAFVIEANNRAAPNRTGTLVVAQDNRITFGVVLAQQNFRDPRGDAAADSLTSLRTAVMTALLGWQPAADFDPCEYADGRLLGMNDYTIWWQDNYVTETQIRSV